MGLWACVVVLTFIVCILYTYTINPFEVLPNLYIGNAHVAQRTNALKLKNVQCIINVTTSVPFSDGFLDEELIRVPVEDNDDRSNDIVLLDSLPALVRKIQYHLSEGHGVLVHCRMGQQRAPTVVAAYLMAERGLSAMEAVQYVQLIKPDAFFGYVHFERTLVMWEQIVNERKSS